MITDNRPAKVHCQDCTVRSCAAAVLGPDEFDLVNRNSKEAEFTKGDILIRSGSMTSHIIYLKSGLVKEFVKTADGREQILQIVKRYSYLGLHSLFGDKVNHYSYAALEDVKICYIDVGVFNELIRNNGEFAYQILISVSRDSLHNFHRFMSQSHKRTYGKLADAMLYFSSIIYESVEFEIPFTRRELADLIGISRESATRVLFKLKEDKVIALDDRKIQILDMEKLQRISRTG